MFTVDNCILKKKNNNNISPVTIAVFYSFVGHDFIISYCNAYYLVTLYSNFERNYFVCSLRKVKVKPYS